MTAFLTTCLNSLVGSLPVASRPSHLVLTTGAMNAISTWMLKLEGCGRYLSAQEAEWLWCEGNKFLAQYAVVKCLVSCFVLRFWYHVTSYVLIVSEVFGLV